MEFTLKDVVYMCVYVATVTALFVKFRDRIQGLEKSMDTAKKVLFLERGGLNVITKEDCSDHRAIIQQQTQSVVDQVHCVNENVVAIMLEMGLKPVVMKSKTVTKP